MEKFEVKSCFDEHPEFGTNYLARNAYHRAYVHRRTAATLVGLAMMFLGAAYGAVSEFWFVAGMTCMLGGGIVEVILLGWLMTPCNCGQTATFTARFRRRYLKRRANKLSTLRLALLPLSAFLFAFAISYFFIRYALMLSGVSLVTGLASLVSWISVLGAIIIGCSATNNIDWLFSRVIIPESECRKIAALSGETEEELHTMIDFHLRAGNYATAERLSARLLHMVECHNPQLSS